MEAVRTSSPTLPAIPKTGFLYLLVLFALALGFYALLLASLAAYAAAFYYLILATPYLLQRPNLATIKIIVPALLAAYGALLVFCLATIRSMFVKARSAVVGIHAHRAHHQSLFTLVREVAEKVGAKPVDEIVITPGSEVGVWEEVAAYLPPGFGKRKVVIGMAALSSLTMDQLKAVMAHEFGHFTHKDTFFSRFVYRVHLGFGELLGSMREVRLYWLNPVVWVIGLYTAIYRRIAASFSRLEEYRADRFAVEAYGRDLFAQALLVAHLEGSFFDQVGIAELVDGIQSRRRHDNIYYHVGVLRRKCDRENPGFVRKVLGSIMSVKVHALDSHPSLGERLRKQNVATALMQIPPVTRLMSSSTLWASVPDELKQSVAEGPPSAAEALFGRDVLKLQSDLSYMAAEEIIRQIQTARARQAAALDAM